MLFLDENINMAPTPIRQSPSDVLLVMSSDVIITPYQKRISYLRRQSNQATNEITTQFGRRETSVYL